MAKLKIFISYVHEDTGICDSVNNALTAAFGNDVDVFVDRVSLQQGVQLQEKIAENLDSADVLIVISTGKTRPSHDWASWEIGWFQKGHSAHDPKRPLWGKQYVLCAGEKVPPMTKGKLYIPIDVKEGVLSGSQASYEQSLQHRNRAAWKVDQIFSMFNELGETINERKGNAEDTDMLIGHVTTLRSRLFAEFKKRPRNTISPQLRLVVRGSRCLDCVDLPDTTELEMLGGTQQVFGLNDTSMTWEAFRAKVKARDLGASWSATLNRYLSSALREGTVDSEGASFFIRANNHTTLYRMIISEWREFNNDNAEASIFLVEVRPRRYLGDERSTKVLRGIEILCRFRFAFLEDQSIYSPANIRLAPSIEKLRSIVSCILTEIDVLDHDLAVAGLHNPSDWNEFTAYSTLIEMGKAWQKVQKSIRVKAGELLAKPQHEAANELEQLNQMIAHEVDGIRSEISDYNRMLIENLCEALQRIYAVRGPKAGSGKDASAANSNEPATVIIPKAKPDVMRAGERK